MPGSDVASASLGGLALSSMYAQRWADRSTLEPFFALGKRLGFGAFELSHDATPEAVAAIEPGRHRFAAIHHPCPTGPAGGAGALCAAAPEAREEAAQALRRSIETAARLGAPIVVLHLGRAEDDAADTARRLRFELTNRFLAGQRHGARYALARDRLAAWVAAREPGALTRAASLLADALPVAAEAGVRLGVETGYHADELPTPEGLAWLLSALAGGAPLGAWLDTGHVGAREAMGFASIDAWDQAARGRWLGAHVHDLVGLRDHLAPGTGTLDLDRVLAMLPLDAPRTLEVDWHLAPEEVAEGARHVLELG